MARRSWRTDLTITMYRYGAGSEWEEHRHPEDQLTIVLAGEILFRSGGDELRLGPGEQVLIPGGVPHSATAGRGRRRHAERLAPACINGVRPRLCVDTPPLR